jgi:hypothetical protein
VLPAKAVPVSEPIKTSAEIIGAIIFMNLNSFQNTARRAGYYDATIFSPSRMTLESARGISSGFIQRRLERLRTTLSKVFVCLASDARNLIACHFM